MLQPEYPQKPLLPKITDHESLPPGAIELARISDKLNTNTLFLFLKWENILVIVQVTGPKVNGSRRYSIGQFEVTLGVLPWFSDALTNFQKPPAEGGLHAGAMSSADQDVEGDMLCIQRAMYAANDQPGYDIVNRSRPNRYIQGDYCSSQISFADNFLYEGGLLQLFTELGEKHKKGLL